MSLATPTIRALRLLATVLLVPGLALASAGERPFAAGETLTYQARIGSLGKGAGTLRIETDEPIRGEPVERLEFDIEARVGPLKVHHQSRSWLSTRRMAALRYQVNERTPIGGIRDTVEIHSGDDGCRFQGQEEEGPCTTEQPLDELSYIYLLRTIPLETGARRELSRHFDPKRNPAVMEVRERTSTTVPAGSFDTVVVELRVIDPARLGGSGSMRFHLTDDERRIPVRIESKVPLFGRLVLELLPGGSI